MRLFEDGFEERCLGGEVVIERPGGDSCLAGEIVDGRGAKTLVAEEPSAGTPAPDDYAMSSELEQD